MHGAHVALHRRNLRAEKFFHRKIGHYLAAFQQHDVRGQVERFVQIVGHQQHRLVQAPEQFSQHVLHFRPGQRIQGSEGLIHQQQFGFGRERPRQADTLALSTGKLVGQATSKGRIVQSHLGKQLPRALGDLLLGPALDFEHRPDVALGVKVRKETRLLDHVADRTPQA